MQAREFLERLLKILDLATQVTNMKTVLEELTYEISKLILDEEIRYPAKLAQELTARRKNATLIREVNKLARIYALTLQLDTEALAKALMEEYLAAPRR